ncbi:hypothetical protein BJY16_008987 [Actinoplanes octamycinicus]|uniref:Uncharacterized protein n=1 Tax=Actinoplanes octamycinicus TaxID=135948 RepID=A0A7W7H7N2_9ACTN|nr:hypothetical protein [Actinoplanes octamycinicus]MBB4745528.1 hypothetical protein [Actinoplanes octamycinicus]GIE56369.1 hypothetical protein Aoc01nite_17710 [Actinoplanes octamycinicus]
MRRGVQVTIGLTVLALIACGIPLAWQKRNVAGCQTEVDAALEHVYTARRWTETDLPGIGDYLEVHYHLTEAGLPCEERGPEEGDWGYQGVLRLRPADGAALAAAYDWAPLQGQDFRYGTPAQMWPGLAPFVPADPGWLHSDKYARLKSTGEKRGDLFLSADHSTAYFVLHT